MAFLISTRFGKYQVSEKTFYFVTALLFRPSWVTFWELSFLYRFFIADARKKTRKWLDRLDKYEWKLIENTITVDPGWKTRL